ncbi:hypothetical protein M758_UG239800 [Ceratodon purpureus]|nr:hypothetical protein M758_UG239800 [Ceratodon purpureus]
MKNRPNLLPICLHVGLLLHSHVDMDSQKCPKICNGHWYPISPPHCPPQNFIEAISISIGLPNNSP